MKSTGIVRMVDELGRVVLPIELRRILDIQEKDPLEFFIDSGASRIMLRKYQSQTCLFCQAMEDLVYYRERFVCRACIREMRGRSAPLATMQESAAAKDAPESKTEPPEADASQQSNVRRGDAWQRLSQVMQSHPGATQGEWARLAGISQSRVSQLLRARQGQTGE